MSELKRIAIFKVGKHTATSGEVLDATPDYLRQVVAGYDPSLSESPAVIGHPKDNRPAYGWVQSLSFDEGEGLLYADFKDVEPQFALMLKDKRFKKRSSSFYPLNHPSNPTKGKPYLRHVGFLGAQPPSVKGLPDFSDDSDCPVYEFSEFNPTQPENQPHEDTPMSDPTKSQSAPQANPQTIPQASPASQPTTDFAEQQAKLDAKAKALADKEAEIAKREAEFAKAKADAKTAEFSDFADGLIKTGQVVPAEKDAIVSVMMDLDNAGNTFDFAEDGAVKQKSSVDVMKGLLSRLDTTVDFSERTATDPNGADKPRHGVEPDKDEDALHQKYLDYAEKHDVSYAEAVSSLA